MSSLRMRYHALGMKLFLKAAFLKPVYAAMSVNEAKQT
jgi:hypothetical protein